MSEEERVVQRFSQAADGQKCPQPDSEVSEDLVRPRWPGCKDEEQPQDRHRQRPTGAVHHDPPFDIIRRGTCYS